MLNQNQIHTLEQYHKGLLNAQDQAEVESWLEDPEFKAEAENYFQLFKGFAALELEAFGEKLQTWEAKHQQKEKEEKPSGMIVFFRKYRLVVAAAVILLMMPLGYWAFQSNNSTDQLFADNFTHFKAVSFAKRAVTPAGTEKEALEFTRQLRLNEGINAYNAKDYAKAIEQLTTYLSLVEAETKVDETRLYLAISYLVEEQADKAQPIFEDLAKNAKSRRTHEAADWYLALTLIKNEEARPAKKMLRKISRKSKHDYQDKAKALLPQLERYLKNK